MVKELLYAEHKVWGSYKEPSNSPCNLQKVVKVRNGPHFCQTGERHRVVKHDKEEVLRTPVGCSVQLFTHIPLWAGSECF